MKSLHESGDKPAFDSECPATFSLNRWTLGSAYISGVIIISRSTKIVNSDALKNVMCLIIVSQAVCLLWEHRRRTMQSTTWTLLPISLTPAMSHMIAQVWLQFCMLCVKNCTHNSFLNSSIKFEQYQQFVYKELLSNRHLIRLSLSANASMDQPHRTSLTNSANRLTSKDVPVFALRRHHRWLSAELGCRPSATGLFRLLLLVSGTICHSTSRLQNVCLSSAVTSRLISLCAAFRDTLTVVVPKKWLCHSGHVNRFCYLLTYLITSASSQA